MNIIHDSKVPSIADVEASLPEVHSSNEQKAEAKAEAPVKAEEKTETEKAPEEPKAEAKAEETSNEVPVAEAPAKKKGKIEKPKTEKKEAEKKPAPVKFIEESVVDENISKTLVESFGISADDAKAIIAKVKESINQQLEAGEITTSNKGVVSHTPIIWNGMKFTKATLTEDAVTFREIRKGETFWVAPFWQTKAEQIIPDPDKTVYQFNHTSAEEGLECSNLAVRKYDEKGKPVYEAVTDEELKKKIFTLFANFTKKHS